MQEQFPVNRHMKIALFIAPILILGGYIISDIYIEKNAEKIRYFELRPSENCDVIAGDCLLNSGEFKVNIYQQNDKTWLNANFQLDRATLFLVDKNNNATEYPLGMGDNPFYWSTKSPLATYLNKTGDVYTLRVVAEIKGGKYFAEFYTQRG